MTGAATEDRALAGITVLELCTGIGGPYAGRLLADLGADVVKVEPPGGDPLRTDVESSAGPGRLFEYLNAGKAGLCLDPSVSVQRDALQRLVAGADIVLADAGSPAAEVAADPAFELAPAGEAERGRVLTVISDFGGRGPYEGRPTTALTLQALSGWVSPRGTAGVSPMQVGLRAHEYVVGVQAAVAALTAVRTSRAVRRRVTTALSRMEAVFNTVAYDMLRHQTLLELGYQPSWTAYIPGLRRCRDGWVAVNCLTGQHWQDMCAVLDVMDYADSYTEMRFDGGRLAEFYERIDPWFVEHDARDILEVFQAFRVPAAPVGDGVSMPGFDQFSARDFFGSAASGAMVPSSPLRMSGSAPLPHLPAPACAEPGVFEGATP